MQRLQGAPHDQRARAGRGEQAGQRHAAEDQPGRQQRFVHIGHRQPGDHHLAAGHRQGDEPVAAEPVEVAGVGLAVGGQADERGVGAARDSAVDAELGALVGDLHRVADDDGGERVGPLHVQQGLPRIARSALGRSGHHPLHPVAGLGELAVELVDQERLQREQGDRDDHHADHREQDDLLGDQAAAQRPGLQATWVLSSPA
jgi:hypothetical protein